MSVGSVIDKNPDLVFQLPFANYKTCEPAVFVQSDPPVFELYMDRFNRFNSEKKFSILHLNVASLLNKSYEINEIVNLRKFDIISLNETKIDGNSPDPIVSAFYNVIRRDRNNSGGGIMIFVKKEYKIARQVISDEAEIVFFQITVTKSSYNFICCYNPHVEHSKKFFDTLENHFIMNLDLSLDLFIIGDLNNDLLNNNFNHLSRFMKQYNLNNAFIEPTRTVTKFYKKSMTYKTSSTLIDVILTNKLQAVDSLVFSCPFSDHCFVGACYNLEMDAVDEPFVWRRNLSKYKVERIIELINEIPIDLVCTGKSIDEMWILFKSSLIRIIDQI